MAQKPGDGGVGSVHPDLVHGGEVGRRGSSLLGHPGVNAGVAAVAVEEEPGVRVSVVGLGTPHPQDTMAVRGE